MSATVIDIQKKKYYCVNDLMTSCPGIFKGYRSSRSFISKNNISDKNYIYAKKINDKWIESAGTSTRFDKIMIKKDYFDEKILNEYEKNPLNQYDDAPPIIELDDNEKFYDDKGNIVEIEIRGERSSTKCYFNVKDIMKGFDINRLDETITYKNHNGYIKGDHYVFFIASSNKKILFVTYSGFIRLVINTKTICNKTQYVIYKWLEQFSQNKIEKFVISNPIVFNNLAGYVYTVTSPVLNAIKIGFWRSFYEGLVQRYKTVYGNNVQIHVVTTFNARDLEKKVHIHFDKYRITNELFQKEYLARYNKYLDKQDQYIDVNTQLK